MIKINGNQVKIQFGTGDIRIKSGRSDFEKPFLSLHNDVPHDIGSLEVIDQKYKDVIEECDVALSFDNVKSIEVLILKLQQARATALQTDTDIKDIDDITTIYQPNERIGG